MEVSESEDEREGSVASGEVLTLERPQRPATPEYPGWMEGSDRHFYYARCDEHRNAFCFYMEEMREYKAVTRDPAEPVVYNPLAHPQVRHDQGRPIALLQGTDMRVYEIAQCEYELWYWRDKRRHVELSEIEFEKMRGIRLRRRLSFLEDIHIARWEQKKQELLASKTRDAA